MSSRRYFAKIFVLLLLLTLASPVLSQLAFAEKAPKAYPEEGKAIGGPF